MSNCLEKYDGFCYVCGKHTLKEHKISFFKSKVEDIYKMYFELDVFPDEPWVPKHVCRNCYNALIMWSKGERNSMNFGIPMRWREPGDHDKTLCYVCQNNGVLKLNRHRRKNFEYKSVPSALLPVPHSDELPVPVLRVRSPSLRFGSDTCAQTQDIGSVFLQNEATSSPILMSHMDFFEKQLSTESDEHDERFHQTCFPFEERYKGKSILSLIADLCWTLFENGVELPRGKRKTN